MIPWEIQAASFTNCNCAYGCPCQFNALPTYGNCEAVVSLDIDKGHFGDVSLDGQRAVLVCWWPGPIHEGGGKAFIVVDEQASEEQRNALLAILSGEETDPGATIWNVFAATFDEVFEPAFKPIVTSIDIEERKANTTVEGLVKSTGTPILNVVTQKEHRARIQLDGGFEYLVAEMGSGTSSTTGPIVLDLNESYGQFANIHLGNHGIVQ